MQITDPMWYTEEGKKISLIGQQLDYNRIVVYGAIHIHDPILMYYEDTIEYEIKETIEFSGGWLDDSNLLGQFSTRRILAELWRRLFLGWLK